MSKVDNGNDNDESKIANNIKSNQSSLITLPPFWTSLSIVLLICLLACVWAWKPWQTNVKATDRTISVTGEATITAEPDEFIFSPSYDFTNPNKTQGVSDLTAKSDAIVAKLKAMGVPSNKIKTDASNYGYYYDSTTSTYTLSLTITVDNKTLAQKVQDYLLTTNPSGDITPQANFSAAKQKSLENQARNKAEQDARSKADQSAKNLGFKVRAVKSVQDGSFDGIVGCGGHGLCMGAASNLQTTADSAPTLSVQPGENDLPYSVSVTYYIN